MPREQHRRLSATHVLVAFEATRAADVGGHFDFWLDVRDPGHTERLTSVRMRESWPRLACTERRQAARYEFFGKYLVTMPRMLTSPPMLFALTSEKQKRSALCHGVGEIRGKYQRLTAHVHSLVRGAGDEPELATRRREMPISTAYPETRENVGAYYLRVS